MTPKQKYEYTLYVKYAGMRPCPVSIHATEKDAQRARYNAIRRKGVHEVWYFKTKSKK